ncbi:Aldehyde/histidinol dehydrogenase [Fusarium venenatum]|uniref:Aldehyde/histidinol dehydrogenase n=1 Tax=Fusarium venenatum TaxID=56646 RepID=UPI001D29CDDF|nr:Aldehyde/histidinol dehydrogenase [Fusarium venenatum]
MLTASIKRAAALSSRHSLSLYRRYGSTATQPTIPLIINGQQVHGSESSPVISPLTGKEVWSFSCASKHQVQEAVQNAHDTFNDWSRTKVSYRRDIFLKAAEIIEKRREELGGYMHLELGANKFYQDFVLGLTIEGLKDTAGRIAGAVQAFAPESTHEGSEFTPRCYWAIADVLREAGLPDGCLNLIFHSPTEAASTINTLVSHPHVKKINFTGSTRVGRIISSLAGKHLKPVLMELGGKASAVVLKDADLDQAALHCARGAFLNAGQICMSTERILVDESISSEFQERLGEAIRKLFGAADDTPAVVTAASATRNRGLIQDAISKGAQPLKIFEDKHAYETDTKMRPVVLGNINKDMDLYASESFGPSVSLFTFKTEKEALELANDTEYGLAAAIFSKDLRVAFRLADGLESGAVHINSMTVHDEYSLPHGGVKDSGFGRFNGYQGLDEFLYFKSVTWMD